MVIQLSLLLLCLINYFYSYDYSKNVRLGTIDLLIISFGVVSFLSILFGYSLPENDAKRWLLAYTGIFETTSFYFITIYLLNREGDFIIKILTAFMISVFSAGIVSLIELNTIGYSIVNIFLARMRIGFGFHNTNLFGIYSVLLFPLIVYLINNNRSNVVKYLSYISFGTLTALSVLCFNRGTFIVLGIQLILLIIYTKDKKLVYSTIGFLLVAAVYFNKIFIVYLIRFFGNNTSQGLDESTINRLDAWRVGFNSLILYPFGVGAGGFQLLWEKYGINPTNYLGTPHQLFLSIGIDYGLPTLLFFLAILYYSFKYSFRIIKVSKINSSIFKYIIIALIGYIIYGMITDGELSHLSGFIIPNNGYSIYLFTLFAIISFNNYSLSDE